MNLHPAYALELVDDHRNALLAEAAADRLARSARTRRPGRWARRRQPEQPARRGAFELTAAVAHVERGRRWAARTPIPAPDSAQFCDWAARFAHQVADGGFVGVERRVAQLVRLARRGQVAPTATAILADRRQPVNVRQRAIGEVLSVMIDRAPCARRDERPHGTSGVVA